MASYTMQLREYIEQATQYSTTLSMKDKIEEGRKKLFDFDYPIFDEAYKKEFETHFIRKFYMREIGFETEGLFKFNLETWLIINMPYFNKMFESELIEYDPLTNSKMDVSHNKTNGKTQSDTKTLSGSSSTDGTTNSTNSQSSDATITDDKFNRNLESNNPDSRLSITSNDGQGVIEYASRIEEDNENNTRTSNGSTSGTASDTSSVDTTASSNETLASNIDETEDFVQSRFGKIGVQTYSKMIMEYRQALLRVENTIFEEMQQLFMLVY